MSFHLPDDLASFVNAKVQSGRFASSEEAIAEAVRLLRDREEHEGVLEGIRQGLEEMQAGKGRPADVVFAEIRRDLILAPDA